MSTAETPYALLRAELARDGARPFITYYDDATGERVELSVTTFDNWVAKTAGLLQDGLSVAPRDRAALLLPAHWQGLVWACACWAVGATVVIGPDDTAEVAVGGPDALDALTAAVEGIALSLRPLGGRFTEPLPTGVSDYALEVPGYPDQFVPYGTATPDDLGLDVSASNKVPHGGVDSNELPYGGYSDNKLPHGEDRDNKDAYGLWTLGELVDGARSRATSLGVEAGARVLVATDDLERAVWDALLLPLAVGGSAVLVRHEKPAGRDARIAAERVDVVV